MDMVKIDLSDSLDLATSKVVKNCPNQIRWITRVIWVSEHEMSECFMQPESMKKEKQQHQNYRCISLCEPHMKHRKRPLWSLPTCQSALHRDRLLPLLMCRTDRPETHMQTQTQGGEKKGGSSMSLTGACIQTPSLRRYNHDDQPCGQSAGLLFYIWIPISLSDYEACWGPHSHL